MATPIADASARTPRPTEELDHVVIRFSGDSGDGMQITGSQFTNTAAVLGNDLATFPDFPAEIRAPAGTTFGVSGFQLNFASKDVFTPGDQPDVLVAMNPAALKVNLADLRAGGLLIINKDEFTSSNLERAGYAANPKAAVVVVSKMDRAPPEQPHPRRRHSSSPDHRRLGSRSGSDGALDDGDTSGAGEGDTQLGR